MPRHSRHISHVFLFAALLLTHTAAAQKWDAVRAQMVYGSDEHSPAWHQTHSAPPQRAPFVPDYSALPDACPEVQIPATSVSPTGIKRIEADCPGRPVTIQPQFSVSGGQPTSYTVEAIPYDPPVPDNITLSTINKDDEWAAVQTLPFGFCFYENTYTQVAICANGILSFNAQMVSGKDAGWRTERLPDIPSPEYDQRGGDSGYTSSDIVAGDGYNWLNAIYGVFEDVNPYKGGTISYGVIGQAPCRKLVVMWQQVPLYYRQYDAYGNDQSSTTDKGYKETFSIVLYEGTNVIDVYVGTRHYDSDWNSGCGIIGVQNSTGTKGTAAPGRNNTDVWSTVHNGVNTPEAWRFVPQTSTQAQYTMSWYRGQGTRGEYLGQGDTYTFYPRLNVGMRDTVTVNLSITSCGGETYQLQDMAEIVWPDIDELVTQRDEAHICQGQTYTYRGQQYNQAGTYYAHGPNDECDEPSVLNLIVHPTYDNHIYRQLCPGSTLTWDSREYDNEGQYTHTYQSINGCDSTVTLHITWLPTYKTEFTHSICQGDEYQWQGEIYSQPGDYTRTLSTHMGCDSTVTMHLVVNPTYNTEFNITTCDNEPYHWQGTAYSQTGDYTRTLSTHKGCDSIVTLHLTALPTYERLTYDTINFNEKYIAHGVEVSTAGRYSDVMKSSQGCDSAHTIILFQHDSLRMQYHIADLCPDKPMLNLTATVSTGVLDSLTIDFLGQQTSATFGRQKTKDIAMSITSTPRAGYYPMLIKYYYHNTLCATETQTATVLYPATVLEQKWDDFIGVLTPQYNGGYDFTDFQWYKDGDELVGQTGSYIYEPLTYGAQYQCLLTDTSGLKLMTCPLTAEVKAQISLYPTLVTSGGPLQVIVSEPSSIRMYSLVGQHITTTDVDSGVHQLVAPRQRGVYLIDINTRLTGQRRRYEMLVR